MTPIRTLAAVAGLMACAASSVTTPAEETVRDTLPSWRNPAPDMARGEQLAPACLTCHAAESPQVDPPAPRLHRQRQSYLFHAILAYRDGTRQSEVMAPFVAGLSEQDARDLAAYLSGEMHDRPPRARTDMPAYRFTIRECTWCHGETGIGEFEGFPVLSGQDVDYLLLALEEYRNGKRSDPTMRAVAQALDPAMDRPLAEYYAAHEWLEHGQ